MERRRCNHHTLEQPLSALDCLSRVIDPKDSKTNKNRYIIASQSEEVRRHCRGIKGVPLVYVKRSVMVMEPMTEASLGAREGFEKAKFRAGIRGKNPTAVMKRKRQHGSSEYDSDEVRMNDDPNGAAQPNEEQQKRKKVRGPKGPNPLSVKKPRKAREHTSADINSETQIKAVVTDAKANMAPDDIGDSPDVIGHSRNDDQDIPAKRKRKRKHKMKGLEELKTLIQEDGYKGDISP